MLDDIKSWLNKQDTWLQEAASRIINNTTITDADIPEFVEIIKNQSDKGKKPIMFPTAGTVDKKNVRLHSFGPVEGIDKLNQKNPLNFGINNLSVIYGQNGSGKSSIVRILKKICGKSHSIPLRSDVYSPAPLKQSCIIKYSVDCEPVREIEWLANMQAVDDLSVVDIFDARSGNFYLENETEISYTPPELSLLAELVNICERVKKELDNEKQKLVSALPEIPNKYKSTTWANKYTTLGYSISQNELDELLLFSTDHETNLKSLQGRLSIADPNEAAKRQRAIKEQIDSMRKIIDDCINIVSPDSLNDMRLKSEDAKQKRKNTIDGAKVLDSITEMEGVGTDTWKKMWVAAREYSRIVYQEQVFPYTGENARCPLCQRELDEETKNRLQNFESFIQGKLESDAIEAERIFEEAITSVPVCPTEESLKTMCQAAELDKTLSDEIRTFFSAIGIILEKIRSSLIPDNESIKIPNLEKILDGLKNKSNEAEQKAVQFERDSEGFDREKTESELLELETKQWISQQKKAVEAEISRLKKINQYEQWEKLAGTAGISREAGVISEKLITEAYITRFNDELKRLGAANTIAVELRKTRVIKGQSKHEIRLRNPVATDVGVMDILSDGEKRIVSLAAFLADMTGRNANTPFIFDDPISSLDQEYEEKTIERIIELSKNRQVIIFTHRLSFLSIMMAKADKIHIEYNVVHISREPWGTGNPGDVPIYGKSTKEALNKLKNDRLIRAKKEYETNGQEEYYPLGKAICSDFRIILERIVENVFLSGVVLRYRRDVNTKQLSDLLKITEVDCNIIDGLMTKYSHYEHSQPPESPVPVPHPAEIDNDLDKMISWHDEFSKKKSKTMVSI
jgi:energy-coupling factor transporter ATP-binding protein EcfA2